ncbi:MAG: hypothetical protein JO060_07700 [Candidatus Eremiobacteraeota bacterium]|nr:hypothetical protein [Candidatus Eremiobacteraeota bacterium]MBV9646019.1 hypothetical protein [Candidatus Eremiobacteraeota bacterium]
MTWPHSAEVWTAIGSMGAFIVIALSALVAMFQLRHVRTGNQLQSLLSVERDFHAPELQDALRYCQSELPSRMEDRSYRAELAAIGFIDVRRHPEMVVCNWFNQVGTLVKYELVSEDAFLDLFGRLVDHYWKLLEPTIAVLRRLRGPTQYESFEYLAMRSRRWHERHADGLYPRSSRRLPVRDPWAQIDEAT